jgi:hypothetical protein
LSDYEEDMVIDVALDGLIPADNTLEGPVTKAVSYYRYKPTGERCVLKLKTTTTEQNITCSVQLLADDYYYNSSAIKTIEQKKKVTYKGNISTTGSHSVDQLYSVTSNATINSISVNDGAEISWTRSSATAKAEYKAINVSVTVNGLVISGENVDKDTEVTITVQVKYKKKKNDKNYTTTTIEIKKKISELSGLTIQ